MRIDVEKEFAQAMQQDSGEPALSTGNIIILATAAVAAMVASLVMVKHHKQAKQHL